MRDTEFFSSRRRHTIWTGDWSSDVCSSDLVRAVLGDAHVDRAVERTTELTGDFQDFITRYAWGRSEERRVGKERSIRLCPSHCNNKTMNTKASTRFHSGVLHQS